MACAGFSGWCAVLGLVCGGCSFVNERMPPSTENDAAVNSKGGVWSESVNAGVSPESTRVHPKYCPSDGIWSPVADTVSTIAGLSWVLYANSQAQGQEYVAPEFDSRGETIGQPTKPGADPGVVRAERIFGYSSMVLFGASAIYGYIVEGACASYHKRIAQATGAADVKVQPARHGFPGSVLQFGFGMTIAETGTACQSSGRVFRLDGARAECLPKPGTASTSEVRIQYALGTPSQITVVYHAPRAGLSEQYRVLNASLRESYGAPQVAAGFSASCTASLEQCLAAGEHPSGPVWHWPNGSIEVAPVWQGERALIELRYTREE